MSAKYIYTAFISYKREDEKWAKWLQYKLEHYKLPTSIRKMNPSLPESIRPVFKDTTDLAGGGLENSIKKALESSKYLIVICSPRAVQSPWVCKEVQEFIDSGREEYIIPFIIDGKPNSSNIATECFPQNLRGLIGNREILGINIHDMGRDAAAIKIVSRMFEVRFDALWQRWERERQKRHRLIVGLSLLGVVAAFAIVGIMAYYHRKMQINQARAVAHRAIRLIEDGDSFLARKILVEVLPDKEYGLFSYPHVVEAEEAMRKAMDVESCEMKGGHIGRIRPLSFMPDTNCILAVGGDSLVRIWNIESGICEIVLENSNDETTQVSFSQDGRYLIAGTYGNIATVWDTKTWECIRVIDTGLSSNFIATFSPDSKYALVGSYLYATDSWELVRCFPTGLLQSGGAFSPDGKYIGVPDWNRILISDSQTGNLVRIIRAPLDYGINSVAFHSDGKHMVSTSDDHTLRMWDISSGLCIRTYKGHTAGVNDVSFNRNGKYMLSASDDRTVKLWDVFSGQCIRTFEGHRSEVYGVTFTPDGKGAISSSVTEVRLWDFDFVEYERVFMGHTAPVTSVDFNNDGRYAVSASQDGTIRLWDCMTGRCTNVFKGHDSPVLSVCYSPNGRFVTSAAEDGRIKVWSIEDNECSNTFCGHKGAVYSVAYSADGKSIVSASQDSTVRIWDSSSGKCSRIMQDHIRQVHTAYFHPDGKKIVSTSPNVDLILWSADSNLTIKLPGMITGIFSHNGQFLATSPGYKYIYILDVDSGNLVNSMELSEIGSHLCYSHNDRYIAFTSEYDNVIHIWDTKSCLSVKVYRIPEGISGKVVFSPDDRHILVPLSDGTIRLLHFGTLQELITATRERFKNSPLTIGERREYYIE